MLSYTTRTDYRQWLTIIAQGVWKKRFNRTDYSPCTKLLYCNVWLATSLAANECKLLLNFTHKLQSSTYEKSQQTNSTMPYDLKADHSDMMLFLSLFSYNKVLKFAITSFCWILCSLYVGTLKTTVKWSNSSLYYSQ